VPISPPLTYARRYALFTLVGIAGEDDLDAPDLPTARREPPAPESPKANGSLNGGMLHAPRPSAGLWNSKAPSTLARPELEPEASATLRDRLLRDIDAIASPDDAALWAHRSLPEKNTLIAADALRIDQAFEARMACLPSSAEPQVPAATKRSPTRRSTKPAQARTQRARPKTIDKSALRLAEPRRVRDREHVRSVAKQPCLICGRRPSDPHHLRFAQSQALGRKVSDEFVVPLCRGHHRELHRHGDEAAWWQKASIDALAAARSLWLATHPLRTSREEMKTDIKPSMTAANPSA
jgi:hypothetical protein